ncbi:MAG TPA: TetR/AcrR family transcriptional regulator [Candidatus Didemnitutus sp.]|nr:TetR/AcrR family transcriptional regulator [Candidatus Didemnitutus sp.]
MDAALDLIWEESYGGITIDDICKRADVKKGSFYYFFSSKSDLAVAALERMWAQNWKPNMDQSFSSSVEPLARITSYLESIHVKQAAVKQKYGKVLGCPIVSLGSETSTAEADVNGKIREILNRKRRYYESAIRDAVAEGVIEHCDPAEKAVALAGLIEGIVCQCRIMNDPDVARSLPEMGLRLLGAKQTAETSAKS